jgi:hypothetical protein
MGQAKAIAISNDRTQSLAALAAVSFVALLIVNVVSLLIGGVGPLMLER